jgi:hypothetical protein
MQKEIQVLASDRHVNVEGLNRLLRSLLYAVFIVSLLLQVPGFPSAYVVVFFVFNDVGGCCSFC